MRAIIKKHLLGEQQIIAVHKEVQRGANPFGMALQQLLLLADGKPTIIFFSSNITWTKELPLAAHLCPNLYYSFLGKGAKVILGAIEGRLPLLYLLYVFGN